MKSKHLLLALLLALLVPWAASAQETVTIGDGTGTTYETPFNSLYGYSFTEVIYPASEILIDGETPAGTITAISYYLTSTSSQTNDIVLYMKNVTRETFSSTTDYEPVTADDIVFNGQWALPSVAGWTTITLDTPFEYDGESNLMIAMDENTSGYSTRYFTFTTVNSSGISYYSDSNNPDPYNLDSFSGSKYVRNKRCNIQIVIEPAAPSSCQKPETLTLNGAPEPTSVTLAWSETSGHYNIEYKKASDDEWTVRWQNYEGLGIMLVELEPETAYQARVQSVCDGGEVSGWKTISFSTPVACPVPTGLTFTLTPGDGTVATFDWTENGSATAWQLCINGDEDNLIDMDENPFTYNGFTPEETYTAKVRAVCGDIYGESQWSNTVTFTPTDAYMLTVNDGTATNSVVPVYGTWVDGTVCSQFIIPAATLETIQYGIINQMTFYAGTDKPWTNAEFEVYMAEVDNSTISAIVDWTTMTKVMNAAHLEVSNNIMVVTLDNPYQYLGGNLMIGVLETQSGTWGGSSFYGISATGASMGGQTSSPSQQNFLPKTTFNYIPGEAPACPKPTGLTASNVLARYATFGWTENGEATTWQICFDGDETDLMTVYENPTTVGGFLPETTYTVKVRSACDGEDWSPWSNEVSFTTLVSCPMPTQLTVSNIQARYATISWTESGEATTWQICFDDDETDLITTYVTENPVGGLLPETTYNVKVRAKCGDNDYSAWTENVSFTTLASCITPENVAVEDINAHDATLTWEGDNLSYNIRYQVSNSIYEGFEEGTLPEGWIANLTNSSSGVKTQAAHSGSYGFQFHYNEQNASLISPELSGTENGLNVSFFYKRYSTYYTEEFYVGYTTDETVIDPADFIYGDIISVTSTDWEMYQNSFPQGTKRIAIKYVYNNAYYLYLDDFEFEIPSGEWTEDVASTNSYLISGLDPETTYLAQVQGVCDGEVSRWSESVSFTTAIACPAPTNLSVMQNSVTAHAAQLTWDGTASVWEICLNGDEDNLIEINENPYLLEDLDPETTYTVKVRANCGDEDGVSAWSNTVEFTTDIACHVPTNLTVIESTITTESAELTWEPGTDSPSQDTWQIAISTEEGFDPDELTDLITINESPTYTFDSLTQNTTYYIYVRSNCHDEGYSDWSAMSSFTTLPTCQIPVGAEISNLTPNSATLSWTGNANSYILTLGVEDTPFAVNFDDIENIPAEFDNTSVYPWIITEGTNGYCMQSGNAGVSSSTSSISLNMYYVADGTIEFDAQCMGEGTSWDVCRFYIDGEQMFSKGANGEQWEHYAYNVTEGEHTFTWSYSKDSSVNPTGDHFAVDNIVVGPSNIIWNEPIVTENSYYFFDGLNDGTTYIVMIQGVCGEDYSDVAETYFTTPVSSYTKDIVGYGENTDGGYYLIASPVVAAVPAESNGFLANEYDLYAFNQSAVHEEWRNYKEQSFNLFAGKGYLYANSENITLTFTGKTYTGDGVFPLVYDVTAYPTMQGANLVGNPFTETAYIDRDFYVMNETGTEIIAAPEGYEIEAMTGLFVIANEEGENVTFSTEAPAKSSSLNLNLSQNSNVVDRAIVRFDSKRNMPKFQLRENSTKVYIPKEGKDYAVACAGEIGEMPVSFKAESNGNYTLSFTSQEVSFSYLHLIDNMTGEDVNLLANPSYTFNAQTTDYTSRFRLVFATGSSVDGDSFGFINGAGNLSIFGIEGEATVQVIDVLGHVLSSETFSGSYERKLDVAPGVYMVRLIQGNDIKVQKMVIK